MAEGDRPRPPAWLSTSGSKNARSGYGVARTQPATPARASSAKATRSRNDASQSEHPKAAIRHRRTALSDNGRIVLERRYLAKDARGKLTETPEQLFRRVAHNIALAEAKFVPPARADATVAEYEARFYDLMTSLRFLPNSPTLGNAGPRDAAALGVLRAARRGLDGGDLRVAEGHGADPPERRRHRLRVQPAAARPATSSRRRAASRAGPSRSCACTTRRRSRSSRAARAAAPTWRSSASTIRTSRRSSTSSPT